jgi:hypothetical protein
MIEALPLVYVAGPFAPTPQELARAPGAGRQVHARNTRRAEALGRYATQQGYAPFVPHSSILRGVYGNDNSPDDRERGLRVVGSIAQALGATPRSEFWCILRDDRTRSPGSERDYRAFATAHRAAWGAVAVRQERTWEEWAALLPTVR